MENTKAFEYTAEFKFDKKDFEEFSAVNYRHHMRISLYILLLYIAFTLYYIFRYGFIPVNPLFHIACIVFAVIVFFVNSSRMKTAAEKEVMHWEKPCREYLITFGENICVKRDGREKVYSLNEVKKLFKAGSLYCLYLHSKSYIIVKPSGDTDFPAYIISKCEKMRSKRVHDLENAKKANKVIFIVSLAVMALCLIFVSLPFAFISSAA
ncbi:MAG: hypothetical protein IJ017_06430 [Oscillospiraceae bacterium]|nr:hypothetical protein [Oscillospiraceae bacterium]